ncbi:MAG: M42 family metallopeptidase [Clostridia bacterium]|jgi:putative aminopeptidase FrvX
MKELLRKLVSAYGPSGNEGPVREIIKEEIQDFVDNIQVDALGNLIAIKKGEGTRVMVAAHMDQIGFIVTHIDEKGFLRFSNVGGISVQNSFHSKVRLNNGVRGVIGYETDVDDIKKIKLDRMFIDIGASSREEAEKLVSIGDMAVYDSPLAESNGRYFSGAMDDRVGCAVQIETIKRLPKTENEIYFVFTVQEEVGTRGAKTAAFALDPEVGFALDVTLTGDTPKAKTMAVKLGDGPAIKVKDASVLAHPKVKELMVKTAKENGIPYQMEVLVAGGTDSGPIHLTRSGVPSGVLSIPCRYVHSDNEMVDANDVENAVRLMVKILEKRIVL